MPTAVRCIRIAGGEVDGACLMLGARSRKWRDALLSSVAAGALSLGIGGPALAAPDACTINGTVAICVGNQSAGISSGVDFTAPPVTTLDVENLTQAIAPASGTQGIRFVAVGADVTINSNTGSFGISATNAPQAIDAFANGGAVTVTSTGNITDTTTNGGIGISAESSGDHPVTVTSSGNITTSTAGSGADGIFAYGLGGGVVTVTSTGNISTAGASSNGIYAKSHGGGAGDTVTVSSTGNISTTGAGSDGILASSDGAVTVNSTGNISTTGNGAAAIFAQNYVSATPGAVTVTSNGNITTTGTGAIGIYADNASHSAVTVTSTGNITTTGDGIFAKNANIGGAAAVTVSSTGNIASGANGIYALTGGAVTVTSTGNITAAVAGITVTGNGGAATVTSTGNITAGQGISENGETGAVVTSTGNITATAGDGIYARTNASGPAAVTSTGNITASVIGIFVDGIAPNSPVTVTSIGNITSGGVGIEAEGFNGAMTVTSTGNITTTGVSAAGISAYTEGSGASITVTSTGNITTAGASADGIEIRNTGGGGSVTLTSAGNITTTGAGADGIFALSNGGPISVTVKSGTVSGGSGAGAGVFISGGTNNTLNNLGTLTALSGLAIEGDTGNNTVNNFGTVIGNVVLGGGSNAFNNMAGGLFDAGATVNLGAGNTLTNAGTLSPGGVGVIETTALTGNLVQTATGRLLTDVNIAGGTSDLVNVSGTASLAGTVQLQVESAKLGPWQQTVLSAAGGATDNGLTLTASPLLQAQLVFPNATNVVVESAGINFLMPGLNANQTALADALNAAAPNAGLGGPVFNFLFNNVTSLGGYGNALTQLDGEDATGAETSAFHLMNEFLGLMLDPSGYGGGGGGSGGGGALGFAPDQQASLPPDIALAYAGLLKAPPQQTFAQRWTAWGAGFGGSGISNGDPAVGSNNVTTSTYGYAAGLDYHYSPDTVLGFSLAGGGTNWNLAQGLGTGRSDAFLAGVHGVTHAGPWYVAGALAFANNWFTTNRTALGDQLTASFQGQSYAGRLEGGYHFAVPMDHNAAGVTPYAAIQAQNFHTPAYSETDLTGGGFGLSYNAMSGTDTRSELGSRFDDLTAINNLPLILRAKLAWAHDWVSNPALNASFESLPGTSFTVNGAPIPHNSALASAGAQLFFTPNWSFAAKFDGEFAGGYQLYAGTGTLRYTW